MVFAMVDSFLLFMPPNLTVNAPDHGPTACRNLPSSYQAGQKSHFDNSDAQSLSHLPLAI